MNGFFFYIFMGPEYRVGRSNVSAWGMGSTLRSFFWGGVFFFLTLYSLSFFHFSVFCFFCHHFTLTIPKRRFCMYCFSFFLCATYYTGSLVLQQIWNLLTRQSLCVGGQKPIPIPSFSVCLTRYDRVAEFETGVGVSSP